MYIVRSEVLLQMSYDGSQKDGAARHSRRIASFSSPSAPLRRRQKDMLGAFSEENTTDSQRSAPEAAEATTTNIPLT